MTDLDIYGRTAVAAIAGGLASVAGGGKFANGAVTAAFVHLFNEEAYQSKLNSALEKLRKTAPFQDLEAAARARLGKDIEYKLVRGTMKFNGVRIPNAAWADVDAGIVYIPRGFVENATYLSPEGRTGFNMERVIYHEAHHVAYSFSSRDHDIFHYAETVAPTNAFMEKYFNSPKRSDLSVCIRSNCTDFGFTTR